MNQQDNDFIIVGMDRVIDHAIGRNRGFIEILYSGEQLAELAYNEYVAREQRLPSNIPGSAYAVRYYTGVEEDRETFVDLINQLVEQISQAIASAYVYMKTNRPVIGYAYKDQLIFLQLG